MAIQLDSFIEELKTDPTALFKVSNKEEIEKRIALLSNKRPTEIETILKTAVNKVDFTKEPGKKAIIAIFSRIPAKKNAIEAIGLSDSLDVILDYAQEENKANDIIDTFINEGLLNKDSSNYMIGKNKSGGRTWLIKSIIDHATPDRRQKIYNSIDSYHLLEYCFNELSSEKLFQEIISTDLLNNELSNALTSNDTYGIEIFFRAIKKGVMTSKQIDSIIEGLTDDELYTFIEGNPKTLAPYIAKFPQKTFQRMIKICPDLFQKTMPKLNVAQKADVIGKLSSESAIKKALESLSEEEKNAVFKQLDNNPSTKSVQASIRKINKEISQIKKSYGNISSNIVKNKLGVVNKAYNKAAIKVLEVRRELREKLTVKIANLHTPEDRFGIINTAHLLLFMNSEKAYSRINEQIKNREVNVKKIEKAMSKREKENLTEKERIAKAKERMQEFGKVAQKRLDNVEQLKRMKKNLCKEPPKKEDKFGKHTLSRSQIEQAWEFLTKRGRAINSIKPEDIIRVINTKRSKPIGKMDRDEIKKMLEELTQKILAENQAKIDEYEENMGRRIGMSNYVFIIAITTITITGLIILLTMILS